ncbi:MAG: helix-turn-helix transcriptional regulator [Patescibacteria group bacterium]
MTKNLKRFGAQLNKLRAESDLSIREVCKLVSYDPSNWSKIERGLISPPSDEKALLTWAKALKVKKNDVQGFLDNAQIAQGIIPDDILDRKEMLELMPAFFRVIRSKKSSKKEIDNLIKLIKQAN